MIFILLAALYGAAQEAFVVNVGAEKTYFVNDHPDSNYSWKIMIDFSPDTEANPNDYTFTTSNGLNQINVQWNKVGLYYIDVIETDVTGCVNRKAMTVNVVINNRNIAFETLASFSCYNTDDNSFNMPLRLQDEGGAALNESYFPMKVNVDVNGLLEIFQISYDNQNILIPNRLINANPDANSETMIKITKCQDVNGQTIEPLSGSNVHVHTVYAIPEIEFAYSDDVVNEGSNGFYQVRMNRGKSEDAVHSWWLEPANGTSTNMKSITTNDANILWDGDTGFYNLYVNVIDGNGCISDTISRLIEVKKADTSFEIYAGQDTLIGNCDFYLFADVYPINDSYIYSWEPAVNLDDPNVPNPLFIPGETTTYVLTVTTPEGDIAKDTITITVEEIEADAGDDVYMELGSTIILDGSGSIGTGLNYKWSSQTGTIESGADTPYPIVSDFGTYYLEVTQKSNCVSIDSVSVIRLAHAPIANNDYDTTNFMSEIIIPVLDNDFDVENSIDSTSLTITLSPLNGNAFVDFNDYTIHYQPTNGFNGNDNFEYQICNKFNNCDRANVYVWVTDFEFLIPDAFSPNGDGINDYFEILGIEYYENNSITIINRSGVKVYEAKNYGISSNPIFWDGKSNTGYRIGNEGLPTGTYFYILKLGNGEKPISGSIYLDR